MARAFRFCSFVLYTLENARLALALALRAVSHSFSHVCAAAAAARSSSSSKCAAPAIPRITFYDRRESANRTPPRRAPTEPYTHTSVALTAHTRKKTSHTNADTPTIRTHAHRKRKLKQKELARLPKKPIFPRRSLKVSFILLNRFQSCAQTSLVFHLAP